MKKSSTSIAKKKMLQARYSPIVSQAEITGKAQPDLIAFNQRKQNAGDARTLAESYPGGDQDGNLYIMPGELVVGQRKRHALGTYHGRPGETGFSSVAGLYYGDKSPEALMREYYFLGVAKTEFQYNGETLFGTDPMDHGFGFLRAGSVSINNNHNEDIYAGDILAWRFPPTRAGDPGTQGSGRLGTSIDTGLNPRASLNRAGTPFTKPLVQVHKFDPSDFSFQLAGAYECFNTNSARGGISDLTPKDLLDPLKRSKLTSLQEEALGWAFGLLMVACRAMDVAQPGSGQTAWNRWTDNGKLTAAGRDVLNAIFLRNVIPGQNQRAITDFRGDGNLSGLPKDSYEYYADNCLYMICAGVAGGWYAKASRIIGKASSNAKPTQTLDIMVSHFKVGF